MVATNLPLESTHNYDERAHARILVGDRSYSVSKFEGAIVDSDDDSDREAEERSYLYGRLNHFKFPPNSSKNRDSQGGSAPEANAGDKDDLEMGFQTPRYTPSASFQIQYQTPRSSSRRSSHKRSTAISITSSSLDSIFSNKPSTVSSPESQHELELEDSPFVARKLDFSSCHSYRRPSRSNQHHCRIDSLPLPLIDLDIVSRDPEPSAAVLCEPSNSARVQNPSKGLFRNPFGGDETIAESGEEYSDVSQVNTALDFDSPKNVQPSKDKESEDFIDLVEFLRESIDQKALALSEQLNCEKSAKSAEPVPSRQRRDLLEPAQADERLQLRSPLCTPPPVEFS